jgi:hypothetical protein
MALINIEYGSIATSKVLNDNFNYLEDKIEDYSKNIASDKASLTSLINSQISTTFTQLNTKITESIQALYPVGSMYIGVTDTCPIAELFGTWEKVSSGRVLQGASGSQKAGSTVEAGLPNITGSVEAGPYIVKCTGAFTNDRNTIAGGGEASGGSSYMSNFNASLSNSIYGKSNTVQPPAYLVNIWRRTA